MIFEQVSFQRRKKKKKSFPIWPRPLLTPEQTYLGLVGGRGTRTGPGPRWRVCWADVLALWRCLSRLGLPRLLRWAEPTGVSPRVGLGAGGEGLAGGVWRVGGALTVLRVGSRISRTLRGQDTSRTLRGQDTSSQLHQRQNPTNAGPTPACVQSTAGQKDRLQGPGP